jgi:hypothetical protein
MNNYDLYEKVRLSVVEFAVLFLCKRATSKCGCKRNPWKGDFMLFS